MHRTPTIVLTTIALACSEAREGIPFHTKSPTSAEPIAPELRFMPSRDRFARMLVEKQFHVVTVLDGVDPAVRWLWFQRASAGFRVAQAAYGNLLRNTFESCVDAVKNGKFVQADDLSRY